MQAAASQMLMLEPPNTADHLLCLKQAKCCVHKPCRPLQISRGIRGKA